MNDFEHEPTDDELEAMLRAMFPQYDSEHPEFDDCWEQEGKQWEWQQRQAYALRMLAAHGVTSQGGLVNTEQEAWDIFSAASQSLLTFKGWN